MTLCTNCRHMGFHDYKTWQEWQCMVSFNDVVLKNPVSGDNTYAGNGSRYKYCFEVNEGNCQFFSQM